MKKHSIQLTIKLDSEVYFEMLLQDFFSRDKSPFYPICITSEWTYTNRPQKGSDLVHITRYNYRVVEAATDPDKPDKELAEIRIRPYPSLVLVFFEDSGTSSKMWENVEVIVRDIIIKAKELDYEVSAVPAYLMPKSHNRQWEEVADHYFDRTIVELWWGGATNSEIGKKLNLAPRTVTNSLSRLRGKYGEDIVPTNEQRRRKLLKNL